MAKVAFLFHLCCGLVSLAAVVGLWFIADRIGTRQQMESFLGDLLGTKDFQLFGDKLFRAALGVTGGLILLATVGTVVLAFLYNMLSSIFGGVVVSVLQERVPLPRDVMANAAAAQAETETSPGQRRRRRSRRRRKRRPPVAVQSPPVYEPPVYEPPATAVAAVDSLQPAKAAGTGPNPGESSTQETNVWAPDPVQAEPSSRNPSTRNPSSPGGTSSDADDWIAAASDPTGSWMAPGSR